MLTCREFAMLYEAYRTRKLPYTTRAGMVMHKTMCKHCKKYVQQIDLILTVSKEIGQEPEFRCDDQLKERLRQAYATKHSA